MSRMLRQDWLAVGRKKKSRSIARTKARRSLIHEPLEDRRLLAVVTSTLNAGAGSLREAIATGDDTITFEVDNVFLTSGQITIPNNVLIDGSTAPSGMATIDGGASGRIFVIDDGGGATGPATITATLQNMTLQNASVAGSGGAILSQENLVLTRVTAQNNYAGGDSSDGGFLQQQYGTLTITDSVITNNRSTDDAGGIDVIASDEVMITGTTISNNQASVDSAGNAIPNNETAVGGGLRVLQAGGPTATNVTIDDSIISGNTVTGRTDGYAQPDSADVVGLGGGLLTYVYGNVNISNSLVSGNYATYYDPGGYADADLRGGGLYLGGSANTYIDNVVVTENYSQNMGAGIHTSDYGDVNVSNSVITNNYGPAGSAGGGIQTIAFGSGAANLTVSDTTISGNTSNFGAGLQVQQGSNVTLERVNLYGNYSYASGAAVYAVGFNGTENNQTLIDRSSLRDNRTAVRGGAVAAATKTMMGMMPAYGGLLRVNNTTISGNSVANDMGVLLGEGGGIYADMTNVDIFQSTVSGNSALLGGGLTLHYTYDRNSDSKIDRSTITNNFGMTNAGGHYSDNYTEVSVLNTIISGNSSLGAATNVYIANPMNPAPTYSYFGDAPALYGLAANPNATIAGGTGATVPVETHEPMTGSPVINMGDPSVMDGTDQNNNARVIDGRMDIGSVESGAEPPVDACDFDGNGECELADIDMLTMELAEGGMNLLFDVNDDGVVDNMDLTGWLALAGSKNLDTGNPYLVGDFTLDGIVDGLDFVEWNNFKFSPTGKWSMGDANADGNTDGLDFIEWNNNKFTSSGTPTTLLSGGDPIRAQEFAAGRAMRGKLLTKMTEPAVSRKQVLGESHGRAPANTSTKEAVAFATPAVKVTASDSTDKTEETLAKAARPAVELAAPATLKSARLSEISTSQTDKDEDASQSALDKFFASLGA